MARGKSLKIFMMDGDVAGRWICTLAGRITKAYRIPRALYKKCSYINELKDPQFTCCLGMKMIVEGRWYILEKQKMHILV